LFQQDSFLSTWTPYNVPHIHNLEWDPREEHEVDFPHGWVLHPMAAAAGAFLKSLVAEPPIKPGTPDPYMPPRPGELRGEEHVQIGAITQYVTARRFLGVGSGEAAELDAPLPPPALPNCSCSFPASSSHREYLFWR
jgi:hypothetical protein